MLLRLGVPLQHCVGKDPHGLEVMCKIQQGFRRRGEGGTSLECGSIDVPGLHKESISTSPQ